MAKKSLLVLALAVVAAGGVFAQEKYDGSFKNTIYFGPVMAGYERALNQRFSIGVEAGLTIFGLSSPGGTFRIMPVFADAFARWYPGQRIFFVSLGVGYGGKGFGTDIFREDGEKQTFGILHIKPQAGWKIDIGKAGAWTFETRVGFGITLIGDSMVITPTVPLLFGRTF